MSPATSADTGPANDGDLVTRPANRRRSRALRLALGRTAALLAFLGLWWAVTTVRLVPALYLPSPVSVGRALVMSNRCQLVGAAAGGYRCGEQGYFLWEHLLASLGRMGVGLGAALAVGPLLGLVLGSVPWLETLFAPALHFVRSLPPLGYIGLLIVWFGIGDLSKWLLLFLAAFPPLTVATLSGLRSVSADWLRAGRSLGASRLQLTRHVLMPALLPDLMSGIRIAAGFAWTTVVAAELNNGLPGIGGLAYVSGQQLNTPLTIGCIIVIGLAAVALDSLIGGLAKKVAPWQGKV